MYFRNGFDFENAVLGRPDGIRQGDPDFTRGIRNLIEGSRTEHPKTRLGMAIFSQLHLQLERVGINTQGLKFLSALDSKIDFFHHTDGIIYVPSLDPYLVTIDLFNIRRLDQLRSHWIDLFPGKVYTPGHFQSDLFMYKTGLVEYYRRNHPESSENIPVEREIDFRQFCQHGRPENHFIVTPSMVGNYKSRRSFACMVARYFLTVSCHEGIT